ncbi:MAG: hypothetical protein JXD22_00640 [Sedimentisphaerales bacterium]|nr:hypothetical protein [Sedimentisphaerales bacterium]
MKPHRTPKTIPQLIKSIMIITLVSITSAAVLVGLTMYFLLKHQPADYRPVALDPPQQKLAKKHGDQKYNELYNSTHRMQPFVINFDQVLLNQLLSLDNTRDFIKTRWPEFAQQFRNPQISFDNGKIHLMGQTTLKQRQFVMVLTFVPRLTNDGQLEITLDSVSAGALKIPNSILDTQLRNLTQKFIHETNTPLKTSYPNDQNTQMVDDLTIQLAELINKRKILLDSQFRVVEDKSTRIEALRIDNGRIELLLQPIELDD